MAYFGDYALYFVILYKKCYTNLAQNLIIFLIIFNKSIDKL